MSHPIILDYICLFWLDASVTAKNPKPTTFVSIPADMKCPCCREQSCARKCLTLVGSVCPHLLLNSPSWSLKCYWPTCPLLLLPFFVHLSFTWHTISNNNLKQSLHMISSSSCCSGLSVITMVWTQLEETDHPSLWLPHHGPGLDLWVKITWLKWWSGQDCGGMVFCILQLHIE